MNLNAASGGHKQKTGCAAAGAVGAASGDWMFALLECDNRRQLSGWRPSSHPSFVSPLAESAADPQKQTWSSRKAQASPRSSRSPIANLYRYTTGRPRKRRKLASFVARSTIYYVSRRRDGQQKMQNFIRLPNDLHP
ncbi:uncharacterized protein HMPREF1120_04210 [Exophiala dermatitidis NIH/UT8656]|uniref:Uncharacterized protein n=1 Tax=Exophiala dermatitidis (strain ATCC 34100 / CBS 525.76 / NIH/UT8656) TaxID=858893 RepID=H6BWQ0_EXODN|nr:uncharacterized protein HMPREF1120_04210 [Exophiala dermatitidis NIH/UT8656]EHY56111.1 hypothetical protein HMPREF1120_04210 [Exophiala dermatitidis NIH/UT8656]